MDLEAALIFALAVDIGRLIDENIGLFVATPHRAPHRGQQAKPDRLAPKVLNAIDGGRSYRWIARDLGISH